MGNSGSFPKACAGGEGTAHNPPFQRRRKVKSSFLPPLVPFLSWAPATVVPPAHLVQDEDHSFLGFTVYVCVCVGGVWQ